MARRVTSPATSSASPEAPATERTVLIDVDHVSKSFASADGNTLQVLDDVSIQLHEGEVVALLGKSGCGKSTILRAMAGLIAPTTGTVRYRGQPLAGANPGAALVFQSFALMPWLTVQDNVELGLKAAGIPPAERRERALQAIDQIGLDGFETAYPRELSGGMRQRVGVARALVMRPDVLMMDEPFSALDALTTENLRFELMSMWAKDDFPTKCICIVTHNIEEAVILADRVIVLGSNPGHVRAVLNVDLPRPRDQKDPKFEALVDRLYDLLTGRDLGPGIEEDIEIKQVEIIDATEVAPIITTVAPIEASPLPAYQPPAIVSNQAPAQPATPLNKPLPNATVGGLAGLLELISNSGGHAALDDLASQLNFEVDDLFPLVDAAQMLGMMEVRGVHADLTPEGEQFAKADILTAKHVFAQAAMQNAPLVQTMTRALAATSDGTLREDFFRDLLRRGYTTEQTEKQLDIAIDWGRYGELYDYDARTEELKLDTPPVGVVLRR